MTLQYSESFKLAKKLYQAYNGYTDSQLPNDMVLLHTPSFIRLKDELENHINVLKKSG